MSAYPARLKTSRRMLRLFPWISGLVLVAGIVAFLIVFFGNTAKSDESAPVPGKPTVVQPVTKSVPVPRRAKIVAGSFILTAVQRKNLDKAWSLAGPAVREGMTHKQWMTGNIAVVPWFGKLGQVPLAVDYSVKDEVQFTVILQPKPGTPGHPDTFKIMLHKFGKRWLVNSWVPFEPPPIKANPNN